LIGRFRQTPQGPDGSLVVWTPQPPKQRSVRVGKPIGIVTPAIRFSFYSPHRLPEKRTLDLPLSHVSGARDDSEASRHAEQKKKARLRSAVGGSNPNGMESRRGAAPRRSRGKGELARLNQLRPRPTPDATFRPAPVRPHISPRFFKPGAGPTTKANSRRQIPNSLVLKLATRPDMYTDVYFRSLTIRFPTIRPEPSRLYGG
jgi:hypothetical protein